MPQEGPEVLDCNQSSPCLGTCQSDSGLGDSALLSQLVQVTAKVEHSLCLSCSQRHGNGGSTSGSRWCGRHAGRLLETRCLQEAMGSAVPDTALSPARMSAAELDPITSDRAWVSPPAPPTTSYPLLTKSSAIRDAPANISLSIFLT